jgi:hypothetical protein
VALPAQETPATPAPKPTSPSEAAAQESFELVKAGKLDEFAALLHPDDLKAFAGMVTDIVKAAEARNDPNAKLLTDAIGSSADLEKKPAAEVAAGFMRVVTGQVPDYDKLMRESKFEILGEVPAGPDTQVVVYQFVLPTPQAVLVSKVGEKWYVQLDPSYKQMASALKRALASGPPAEPGALSLESVEALGSLPAGVGHSLVVLRTLATVGEDKLEKLSVYPVSSTDPEWPLLAPDKKAELEKALLEKFDPKRGK